MKNADPRAKLYSMLEGIEGEEAAQIKDAVKAWTEELIHSKTEISAGKSELEKSLEELKAEKVALESKIETLAKAGEQNESPRILELEKTVKAMEERARAAEESAQKAAEDKKRGDLFNAVTKKTNLREEFASMLFDREISAGNILEQDGQIGGLVDGMFKPAEEYLAIVEDKYKPYLKVAAGGKNGNYSTGDPQQPQTLSIGEQRAAQLKKMGGSLPVSIK